MCIALRRRPQHRGSAAVQAGKVVLRQSLADILNRPRTPRSLQGWKELPYSGTPGVLAPPPPPLAPPRPSPHLTG